LSYPANRETDRQTDRQTDRHTSGKTFGGSNKHYSTYSIMH